MNSLAVKFRTGRMVWTVLAALYFLIFFANFFADLIPEQKTIALIFSYSLVLWLAIEYYFGSPFFQSGIVEPSALWRGVFAFFVYPYFGYLCADFVWWRWTQIPLHYLITGILGILIFWLGTYLRLRALFDLVRIADVKNDTGAVIIPGKRFLALKLHRLCRHPRYLGTFVQLLGSALVFRSWGGLVLTLILGLPLIFLQVRYEERMFARFLKSDFEQFQKLAPLLFPRLKSVVNGFGG